MRRGEPPAAAEGPERQERADGGQGGSRARRGESQKRRRREDTRASCRRSRVGPSSLCGQRRRLAAARGGGTRGPRTSEQPVPREARARDPSVARRHAALPLAVSPAGAPPPPQHLLPQRPRQRRGSPRRGPGPGSAGGKTRDSPKTPRCARLKECSQSFLWIKKNTIFFLAEEKEDQRGSARIKGVCVTHGYVFPPLKHLVLLCKHFLFLNLGSSGTPPRPPRCEEVVVFIWGFAYLVFRF